MTKGQESPRGGVARTCENRSYVRRKLTTMAYVELGQDNGGILLNIGEGGLAVQSALTLAGPEFPDIRFQLPNAKRWLMTRGRVTWMSESRTEAGIQFLDLRPETQAQIRRWIALAGEESSILTATQTANSTGSQRSGETEANSANFSRAIGPATTSAMEEETTTARNFGFNDYSMFSTEPSADHVAIEPARSRWKSFALLAMCLAILFFVLGASFGRYTFDQWLQPRATERQPQAALDTAADAARTGAAEGPHDQQNANERPESTARTSDGSAESSPPADQNARQRSDQAVTNANSNGGSGNKNDPANSVTASPEGTVRGSDSGVPSRIPEAKLFKSLSSRRNLPTLPPTTSTHGDAIAQTDSDAHTILVNAPGPGSPALSVNLTNEAVGASQWVAISAARSVWIAPRSTQSGYTPERVTIGRLISHSQPFYPEEARREHLEGSVVLRATFGRTGTVLKVAPVSGPSSLAAAGMTAVREWQYAPTYIDGDPVETQAEITMVFRLR